MATLTDSLGSLLTAILANHEDNALRLVYADALDDNGDPDRAEFIRAQVITARWPCNEGAEHYRKARLTELRLFNQFRHAWRDADLPTLRVSWLTDVDLCSVANLAPGALYRRGFVESISLNASDFFAHADTMLARHPIREIRLNKFAPNLRDGSCAWTTDRRTKADNWIPRRLFRRIKKADGLARKQGTSKLSNSRRQLGTALRALCTVDQIEEALREEWPHILFRMPGTHKINMPYLDWSPPMPDLPVVLKSI